MTFHNLFFNKNPRSDDDLWFQFKLANETQLKHIKWSVKDLKKTRILCKN